MAPETKEKPVKVFFPSRAVLLGKILHEVSQIFESDVGSWNVEANSTPALTLVPFDLDDPQLGSILEKLLLKLCFVS